MRSKFLSQIVIFLTFTGLSASAWAVNYVVKKGDTLSIIAQKNLGSPVYPKNGSLRKLLAWNPQIGNPDLIFPGSVLNLNLTEPHLAARKSKAHRKPASESTPVPTAQEAAPADSSSDEVAHSLQVGLGYDFMTISAQDPTNGSSAKLFTSSDLKFEAAWSQAWSDSVSTFFAFDFEKLDFEPSDNASKSLTNTSQAPAHFSLGLDYHVSSRFVLRTSAGYGQELFTGSEGGSTISIDSVFVPSVSEELIFTAVQKGRTSLGLLGGGSYLGSAAANGYSVNQGYAVNGGAFLSGRFGPGNQDALTLTLGYTSQSQNTSLVNQSVSEMGAQIQLSIPLFGGGGK